MNTQIDLNFVGEVYVFFKVRFPLKVILGIAFETVRPLTNRWMFRSLTVSALILLLHENGFIKPVIRNEIVLNGFHTA